MYNESTMSYDALAHAEIKNNMTSPEQMENWRSTVFFGSTDKSNEQIKDQLDAVLSNTTIKRACCLGAEDANKPGNYKVNVRIPVPKGWQAGDGPQVGLDYGFIDKEVSVPKTMCDAVKSSDGSTTKYSRPDKDDTNRNEQCDQFYEVYCPNMLQLYMDESGVTNVSAQMGNPAMRQQFADKFAVYYKPECACYNMLGSFPANSELSARRLAFTGCTNSQRDKGVVYLDQKSRNQAVPSVTICTQVANLSGASAGNDINVQTYMQNNCGNNSSSSSGTDTGGATSGTTSGTTGSSTNTGETTQTEDGTSVTQTETAGQTDNGGGSGNTAEESTEESNVVMDWLNGEGVTGQDRWIEVGGAGILLCLCVICICIIGYFAFSGSGSSSTRSLGSTTAPTDMMDGMPSTRAPPSTPRGSFYQD